MLKTFVLAAFVALIAAPVSFASAFCACCAEPGMYSESTSKVEDYDLEVVKGFEFGKKTNIYMTEADFEIIRGLDPLRKDFDNWTEGLEIFDFANAFSNRRWTFDFKSKTGKTGRLVLPMPLRVEKFKIDPRDGRGSGGGGPLLYKEFRFRGPVGGGTGFFRSGIGPRTSYFLVFQGRGNGCDNTEDFAHWRLEINGPKAQYAFFGELASGPSEPAE